jgi:hypothetical protein
MEDQDFPKIGRHEWLAKGLARCARCGRYVVVGIAICGCVASGFSGYQLPDLGHKQPIVAQGGGNEYPEGPEQPHDHAVGAMTSFVSGATGPTGAPSPVLTVYDEITVEPRTAPHQQGVRSELRPGPTGPTGPGPASASFVTGATGAGPGPVSA